MNLKQFIICFCLVSGQLCLIAETFQQSGPSLVELVATLKNFDKTPFQQLRFISPSEKKWGLIELSILKKNKSELNSLKNSLPELKKAALQIKDWKHRTTDYGNALLRMKTCRNQIRMVKKGFLARRRRIKQSLREQIKQLQSGITKTTKLSAQPLSNLVSNTVDVPEKYDRSGITGVDQISVSKESKGRIPAASCLVNAEVNTIMWWYELGLCRLPPGSGSPALRITESLMKGSPELYWRKYGNGNYIAVYHDRVPIRKLTTAATGLNVCVLVLIMLPKNRLKANTPEHAVSVVDFDATTRRLRFNTWGKMYEVYLKHKTKIRGFLGNWRYGYKVRFHNQDWFILYPMSVTVLRPVPSQVITNK